MRRLAIALVAVVVAGTLSAAAAPSWAAGPPDAPAPATAVAGSQSATVTWAIPADNGSPIIGFRVQIGRAGAVVASKSAWPGPSDTTTTVTGLTPGQLYWVIVTARNAIGFSSQAYAGAITPTAGAPFAPGMPTASPGGGTATVSWTAGGDGGSPITGYVITPYLGAVAQPAQTFASTTTTRTVTGLTNGEAYTFTVTALNAYGPGPPSAASAAVTIGVPSAPRSPFAMASDGAATVSWLAPVTDHGSPVTGYEITPYLGLDAVAQPAQTFPSIELTQAVTGLTNGEAYTFRVAAISANGTGGPSIPTPVIVIGPSLYPNPPAPASVVAGTQSATVTWTIPADNGSPITGFRVQIGRVGALVASRTAWPGPSATTTTITGLVPGQLYWVIVTARNGVGFSPQAYAGSVTPL